VISHPFYEGEKEAALELAKALHNSDFIETIDLVLQSSDEISGGRAVELIEYILHLLKCKAVIMGHRKMKEVLEFKLK